MKDRRTTLYAHAKDNKGQATTLAAVLAMVTDGTLEKPVRAIREKFAAGIANGLTRKEAKKALATEKGGLPCCTFSGLFEKRKADHLEEHTGLIVADLDLLTDDKLATLLNCLKSDPHVLFYFTSPTGTGIKVGVRVPDGLERETHAGSAFWALRGYAKGAWGMDVDTDEFDDSCKDVSRLCFLSHDENLHINWEAKPLPLEWGRAGALVVKDPMSGDDELEEVDPKELEVRKGIIQELYPDIEWVDEYTGQVKCPGMELHTNESKPTDCTIFLRGKGQGAPSMYCYHQSCKSEVNKANDQIWEALAPHAPGALNKKIKQLGNMSPLDFEMNRKKEADRLGIRVGVLDKEVKASRGQDERKNQFDDGHDPWPDPVETGALLEEVLETYRHYVFAPEHHLHVLACATVNTWCLEAFDMTFRIILQSPEYSCGKSQVIDALEKLSCNPFKSDNATQAVMYHLIHKCSPTVLLDEIDSLSPEHREALVNILNAGNKRDAKVWRVEGEGGNRAPVGYNCFAPAIIAGIGRGRFPPATISRAIVLGMTRKPREYRIGRLRVYDPTDLRRKCRRWATDQIEELRIIQPDLPDELNDRQQDVWESFFAIAGVAGGEWPNRIREAALKLHNISTDEMRSTGNELLRHIKTVFDEVEGDRIHTRKLLEKLNALDEAGYGDWNKHTGMKTKDLNRKLAEYDITSHRMRIGDDNLVGWDREQFAEVWKTYLNLSVPCSINSGGMPAGQENTSEKVSKPPSQTLFEVEI